MPDVYVYTDMHQMPIYTLHPLLHIQATLRHFVLFA